MPPVSMGRLLWLLLVSRVYIYAIAGLSLLVVRKGEHFHAPKSIADWFLHWDTSWYLDVAAKGYWVGDPGAPTNTVFLPLYPWLIRLLSLNGHVSPVLVGYGISITGLLIACVLLARLVEFEWRDPELSMKSIELLLFGPVSFFFSTIYSEGVFLPLVIGCIGAARRRWWWVAGACGLGAALTRFVGVMLVVPLLWEWIESYRKEGESSPRRPVTVFACLLPVLGLVVFFAVLWWSLGDPFAYFHGQQHWGRHLSWFWQVFAKYGFWGLSPFYQIWFAAWCVVPIAMLAVGVGLRVPLTYIVFGLTFSLVYVSSAGVEAMPRYMSVVFPLYFILAIVGTRWRLTYGPLLATFSGLQALSVVLFVNGYWFT